MSKFTYKTYRVEWAIVVYLIDDYYGIDAGKQPLYYKGYPTREIAVEHLDDISKPHRWVSGRRVCTDPNIVNHEYHEVDVRYYEKLVDTFEGDENEH